MNAEPARAFTLTELLVVVAIIATLAVIAVPVGRHLLAKSHEATCLGNLRSIGVGLQGYLQDHQQKLPIMEMGRSHRNENVAVLETVLLPYVEGNALAFHCPADKELFIQSGSSYFWNHLQNGRRIDQVQFFGVEGEPEIVPLVSDKESWHPSGTNFLYADASASNRVRFATASQLPQEPDSQ